MVGLSCFVRGVLSVMETGSIRFNRNQLRTIWGVTERPRCSPRITQRCVQCLLIPYKLKETQKCSCFMHTVRQDNIIYFIGFLRYVSSACDPAPAGELQVPVISASHIIYNCTILISKDFPNVTPNIQRGQITSGNASWSGFYRLLCFLKGFSF